MRYEIRQEVKTVKKNWLEPVHESESLRIISMIYDDCIKNNPNDYFELIKIESETCVKFTPKFNDG